jgi:hypothetical protein
VNPHDLSFRRLINAYYAMTAERLAMADMISPPEKGQQTRLQRFDEMLNEAPPNPATWGEGLDAQAEQDALLALFGG